MHKTPFSSRVSAADALADYNQLVLPARANFAGCRRVQAMTSPIRPAHDGGLPAALQRPEYRDHSTQ